jgi:hypothetical protein
MKKFFIMIVLLIPGPESALMKNIDVWLAPLQEELKQLWEVGVPTRCRGDNHGTLTIHGIAKYLIFVESIRSRGSQLHTHKNRVLL